MNSATLWRLCRAAMLLCVVILPAACTAPGLDAARRQFYAGQYQLAENELANVGDDQKDSVLVLMERGTIRQAAGNFNASSADFIAAHERAEELYTYSVSRGTASFVVNDNVQSFRGAPFERTMLHDFTALNHLALGQWEEAAVESRRIIESLREENRGKFPQDAFSRHIAGFGLELIGDDSNAALQYRKANSQLSSFQIDEKTGHIIPVAAGNSTNGSATITQGGADTWPKDERWPAELVCFILIGRSPTGEQVFWDSWRYSAAPYAAIYSDGAYLGRSYNLADVASLAHETEQLEAARKAVKTASRIVVKEGIAQAVSASTDEVWGDLTRIILIGLLEQPDIRRWETLPRWLQVARVPCPSPLSCFDVVIKDESGRPLRTIPVVYPIQHKDNLYVSFVRDLPAQPSSVIPQRTSEAYEEVLAPMSAGK